MRHFRFTTRRRLTGSRTSQLAIEFAHQIAQEAADTWVFWVHAGTQVRVEEGFRPGSLTAVRNCPEAFFDAYLCASMYPEHPCVGRILGDLVGKVDGQLRCSAPSEPPSGGKSEMTHTQRRPGLREPRERPTRNIAGESGRECLRG